MPIQQMLLGAGAVDTIITDNLETYYDFGDSSCWDGSSTTINDLTSNNYNATLTGNSSNYSQSSSNGGYLDLVNTHTDRTVINRSDNNIISTIGTGDYTLEFWINVKVGETGVDNTQMFKSYPSNGNNIRIVFRISSGTTTQLRFSPPFSGDGTWSYFPNFGSFSPGYVGWMHLVFSRIGTGSNNMKGYINNQLKDTWTQSTDWDDAEDPSQDNSYAFGSDSASGKLIARFAVYRIYVGKGFTASEVADNYDVEKARFGLS